MSSGTLSALAVQTVDLGEDVDRIADSLESVQITWVTGLSALVVFVLGIVAARLARRSIMLLDERTDIVPTETIRLGARIVWYLVMFYALGAAMGILGFEIVPMLSVLGIITIVLALGLRPLFENFAAGITLQTRRPFEPGDQVSLLDVEGTVIDITARTVLIETLGGESVHIPNNKVLDNPIINFTKHDVRRSTLDVGLDYATDLQTAVDLLTSIVGAVEGVVSDPPVDVFVHEFGDSTINASIWFWHASSIPHAWAARSRVAIEVKRGLDEAGITIAFPQRVLWWGEEPGMET